MKSSRRQLLQGAGAAAVLAEIGLIRGRAFAAAHGSAEGQGQRPTVGARANYALDPAVTYLNHASIGTVPVAVQRAHREYLELCETNPWLYMWSEPWREPREAVRQRAAQLLGCSSAEVALTHNTTEFFNVLAQGLPVGAGDEVLFSSLNHTGASACWRHHAKSRGYSVRQFEVPLAGIESITEDQIVAGYERQLRPETAVLVLPHVDNQVGLRHPVARIAKVARDRGVRWIAVDGAQTVSMLPTDVSAMGVDVFATSAHKWIQGPKGLGLAYVHRDRLEEIRPMWVTWGQELWRGDARVFEDYGTRALPAELALGDALEYQASLDAAERERSLRELWSTLRRLVGERDGLLWRSPGEWKLGASLVAVEVVEGSSADVSKRLFEQHGIVVRPFSLPGLDALRVSANLANDAADLERFVEAALG